VLSPKIEHLQERLAKRHNFTPVRHRMEIFGTCRECKGKEK
jgi:Fur family ferric uptake transcriptional regulator